MTTPADLAAQLTAIADQVRQLVAAPVAPPEPPAPPPPAPQPAPVPAPAPSDPSALQVYGVDANGVVTGWPIVMANGDVYSFGPLTGIWNLEHVILLNGVNIVTDPGAEYQTGGYNAASMLVRYPDDELWGWAQGHGSYPLGVWTKLTNGKFIPTTLGDPRIPRHVVTNAAGQQFNSPADAIAAGGGALIADGGLDTTSVIASFGIPFSLTARDPIKAPLRLVNTSLGEQGKALFYVGTGLHDGGVVYAGPSPLVVKLDGVWLDGVQINVNQGTYGGVWAEAADDLGATSPGLEVWLKRCKIENFYDGIITSEHMGPRSRVLLDDVWVRNCSGSDNSHGIYIDAVAELAANNTRFDPTVSVGHSVKSRARVTTLHNVTVMQRTSTASCLVDACNGGKVDIANCVFERSANTDQRANPMRLGEEATARYWLSVDPSGYNDSWSMRDSLVIDWLSNRARGDFIDNALIRTFEAVNANPSLVPAGYAPTGGFPMPVPVMGPVVISGVTFVGYDMDLTAASIAAAIGSTVVTKSPNVYTVADNTFYDCHSDADVWAIVEEYTDVTGQVNLRLKVSDGKVYGPTADAAPFLTFDDGATTAPPAAPAPAPASPAPAPSAPAPSPAAPAPSPSAAGFQVFSKAVDGTLTGSPITTTGGHVWTFGEPSNQWGDDFRFLVDGVGLGIDAATDGGGAYASGYAGYGGLMIYHPDDSFGHAAGMYTLNPGHNSVWRFWGEDGSNGGLVYSLGDPRYLLPPKVAAPPAAVPGGTVDFIADDWDMSPSTASVGSTGVNYLSGPSSAVIGSPPYAHTIARPDGFKPVASGARVPLTVAPGTWQEIPNTDLISQLSPEVGNGGLYAMFENWTGGVPIPALRMTVFIPGGWHRGNDNSTFGYFDWDTFQRGEFYPPSPLIGQNAAGDHYPNAAFPPANHYYGGGSAVLDPRDGKWKAFIIGTSMLPYLFDPITGTIECLLPYQLGLGEIGTNVTTMFDTKRNLLFMRTTGALSRISHMDFARNKWFFHSATSEYAGAAAIHDPVRDRFVLIGGATGKQVKLLDLAQFETNHGYDSAWQDMIDKTAAGVSGALTGAFDPIANDYVLYGPSGPAGAVYRMDPDTLTITDLSIGGSAPCPNGTWGRFWYDDQRDLFMAANDVSKNVVDYARPRNV